MVDWNAVQGFEWDDGNGRKSVDKHGVSQAEAEQVFLNHPLLTSDDVGYSAAESRYHALGVTDAGRRLHVTFTIRGRGTLIRIISARDMHRRERARYEEEA